MEPIGAPDGRVRPRYVGPDTFARLPRAGGRATRPGRDPRRAVRLGRLVPPRGEIRAGLDPRRLEAPAAIPPRAQRPAVVARAGRRCRRPRSEPVRHRRGDRPDRGRGEGDAGARRSDWSSSAATTPSRCPCCGWQRERHGPIALVHFDAHLDTWDTYFGAAYTHGTPFPARVRGGPARREPLRPRGHPRLAVRDPRPRRGRGLRFRDRVDGRRGPGRDRRRCRTDPRQGGGLAGLRQHRHRRPRTPRTRRGRARPSRAASRPAS
jgi:hypothetical protein